jgi:hypothetical protein
MNISALHRPRRPDQAAAQAPRDVAGGSIVEITKSIVGDLQELVRAELGLAVAELTAKGRALAAASIPIALGAILALAGLIILLLAIAAVLAIWLPTWASFLIVAVASLAGGGIAIRAGSAQLARADALPEKAIGNVKRDVETIRKHV